MRCDPRTPRTEGFTLVEVMTVILIVGILVTIAVTVYGTTTASAKRVVCKDNQRQFENATNFFRADMDTTPTVLADLEPYVSQYVTASRCPADGRALVFDADLLTVTCTYPGHAR